MIRFYSTCRRCALIIPFLFVIPLAKGQAKLDSLTKHFNNHRSQSVVEKIYLHTDRSFYLTGETMWFKVYQVDASQHKPLDLSKVVYIEVIGSSNQAMIQLKVELKNGFGSGSIFLPASLNSASYSLRAYTSLMKNSSPEFYFQKTFTIVNPFVRPELEPILKTQTLAAQFFPEGGNLVTGLKSKVAFQVTDQFGNGAVCKGAILTARNDTIATFRPLKFGIGHFLFTPQAQQEYHVMLTDAKGVKTKFLLPSAKENGFVMQLEEAGDRLEVIVSHQPNITGSQIYLIAHTRNMIGKTEAKSLQEGKATFYIEKSKLADGISHLTVLDENLRPVCERLFFKQPAQQLITEIQTNHEEHETRGSLRLSLSVNSPSANLSICVFKTDSISLPYKNGIAEYLLLTSDLKGVVESPDYYFTKTDPSVKEACDNLMLTHGWRRFNWDNVLKPTPPSTFLAEYRSHVIKGIVKNSSGAPVSGVMTYMASPSKAIRTYISKSNVKGEVFYETKNFYDRNKIFIQTNSMIDSTYRVELEDPFSHQFSTAQLPALQLDPMMRKQLLSRSIDMQVMDIYLKESISSSSLSLQDTSTFYDKANETYYLDAYTRFTVMEEVMREYVHGVMVRRQKDKFRWLVLDNVNKSLFQEDPLVLLDGVPIFDINKIMAFSPLKIKKMEVIDRKYFVGPVNFSGVVSCTTYLGDLGGFEFDPKNPAIDYEGLERQPEFYSPRYQDQRQRESRVPDNRSLLYWNPSVMLTKGGTHQIEFFASDLPGKYQVVVEGITPEGLSGSSVHYFDVKKH